jgi:murein DD-endopeptidase MepM/ murein hydrolase activator NlpD
MVRPSLSCSVAAIFALALSASAEAHDVVTGGAAMPDRPEIDELRCATGETGRCARGAILELDGEYLQSSRVVTFLGGKGRRDDRRSTPSARTAHSLTVRIPVSARTGPVRVSSPVAGVSAKSSTLEVVAPAPAAPESGAASVFPVKGRYDFGTATNGFGGGRNHQGQDILAACGLQVVAAKAGTVSAAKWDDAAGNHVVIDSDDGTSQVYLHMRDRALVRSGDRVAAGDQLGYVGTTGRSTGCHLHFELWTAPGRYRGGEAIDPLPELRAWATAAL